MRAFRDYLFTMITTTATFLAVVAGLNLFMDPLLCFGTTHSLNQRRIGFDERQQKTNRLAFGAADYDAILLGNSRVTYMDQRDFTGYRLFNYGANFMTVDEYAPLIAFAKTRLKQPLRCVILGLSVHMADSNRAHDELGLSAHQAIKAVSDPLYRFKTLISWEAFGHSLTALGTNVSRSEERDWYDPHNIKSHRATDERYMLSRTTYNTRMLQRRFRHQFRYDPGYRALMTKLRDENPGVTFIVFTTPASTAISSLVEREGRTEDYQRWIKETVEVFGGLHHFEYPNTVTRNLYHYVDGHHYKPEVGRMIARKLMGIPDPTIPNDFGVYLAPDTVDAFLQVARR